MVKEAVIRKLDAEEQWRRVQQVSNPEPEEEMKVDEEQMPQQDLAPSDDQMNDAMPAEMDEQSGPPVPKAQQESSSDDEQPP